MTPPLAAPPLSLPRRLGTFSIGVAFMYTINKLFDYALYPYVIYQAGLWVGGVIMTALSALACLMVLKFYDHSKRDWLGIETIRDLKHFNGQHRAGRVVAWILRRGDPFAFVALSVYADPFITTVWLRHERFGGMTERDSRIFWGSVAVSNLFWTLSCWLGINLVEWLWHWGVA